MKKKIIGLTLMAMSLVAFNGMAQKTCNNNNCAQNNCTKENVKADKPSRPDKMCPFEGLNLTDAQKAKLQQLNSDRKTKMQKQNLAKRDNRMRNDSVRTAEKKAYLSQVKEIVGPDQYVIFLENMYVNGDKPMPRVDRGMPGNKMDKARGHHQAKGKGKEMRGKQMPGARQIEPPVEAASVATAK